MIYLIPILETFTDETLADVVAELWLEHARDRDRILWLQDQLGLRLAGQPMRTKRGTNVTFERRPMSPSARRKARRSAAKAQFVTLPLPHEPRCYVKWSKVA